MSDDLPQYLKALPQKSRAELSLPEAVETSGVVRNREVLTDTLGMLLNSGVVTDDKNVLYVSKR